MPLGEAHSPLVVWFKKKINSFLFCSLVAIREMSNMQIFFKNIMVDWCFFSKSLFFYTKRWKTFIIITLNILKVPLIRFKFQINRVVSCECFENIVSSKMRLKLWQYIFHNNIYWRDAPDVFSYTLSNPGFLIIYRGYYIEGTPEATAVG